jgi:PadR family transcriptional regulator, regulatory protein AphA
VRVSLPHALLGLLNYKSATGYDLKAAFKDSIYMFWNASLPQIYRTLNQMEKNGWLLSRIEHQEGKPSRKIYDLTDKGKKEFRKWLSKPLEIQQTKEEMLVKIFFGNQMNQKDLISHIKARRERAMRFLEQTGKEMRPVVERYATKAGAADDARFWLLTIDYGLRRAKMIIEWCDAALDVVEKGKNIKMI